MYRRIAAVALAAVSITACRPGDTATWLETYKERPGRAMYHLKHNHPRIYKKYFGRWTPDTSCREWAQTALNAGFTKEQWYEPMSRIMYRESHCDPGAYNPSGASGLMQIMPFWASHCGISRDGLFDPTLNIRCAKYVLSQQGWSAWTTW